MEASNAVVNTGGIGWGGGGTGWWDWAKRHAGTGILLAEQAVSWAVLWSFWQEHGRDSFGRAEMNWADRICFTSVVQWLVVRGGLAALRSPAVRTRSSERVEWWNRVLTRVSTWASRVALFGLFLRWVTVEPTLAQNWAFSLLVVQVATEGMLLSALVVALVGWILCGFLGQLVHVRLDVVHRGLDRVDRRYGINVLFQGAVEATRERTLQDLEAVAPSADLSQRPEEEICSICLMDTRGNQPGRVFACGHCFHCSCVDVWCQQHGTCPLCRATLFPPVRP